MQNNLNYNERAWAIDVISEINILSSKVNRPIKRAGGEHTLSIGKKSMFPDVLLFGDKNGSSVLQGWELKMPDTSITDNELISNATIKANRLKLNSFLLWNVKEAVLYVSNGDSFLPLKNWSLPKIKVRQDVVSNTEEWKGLLIKIADDLNNFLENGEILPTPPEVAINEQIYADFLLKFNNSQLELIKNTCQKDAEFELEIDIWFEENKEGLKPLHKYQAVAHLNIVNWINRFLFAHYLKLFNENANLVEKIDSSCSVEKANYIFEEITSKCDFMNVFKPILGQRSVNSSLWQALLELNQLLIDFNFKSINQKSFHNIIDTALSYSRKKLAGQFSTPVPLADYLVAITINDRTKNIIDVCCGTGTIAKSIYNLKINKELSVKDALATTWASDKFAVPLQLCSIALSDPNGMGEIIQSFKKDALLLSTGELIEFTAPYSGDLVVRELPKMHAVTSNLPFVRFEDVVKLNPNINATREYIYKNYNVNIDRKADLYAYITLKLKNIVEENGRIGLITSNSWQSVSWGNIFKKALLENFNLLRVVISGNGRWFTNTEVITTVIVLEAKSNSSRPQVEIPFITTLKPINKWDKTVINEMVASTLRAKPVAGLLEVKKYSLDALSMLEKLGLGWNALFTDTLWLDKLKEALTPVNTLFIVNRGERRGWDALFYPETNHNIEAEFIKPVLKSSRNLEGRLVVNDDDKAFCCSQSIEYLEANKKTGALNWIKRFASQVNNTGKPLPEVLSQGRHNLHWYEMRADTLADIVISMNPDKKLCFHKLTEKSFVNQRLIRLTTLPSNKDVDLCHALLNSVVGMFLLESIGFGRGLGALDINATKVSEKMHMLNPKNLKASQKSKILKAFKLLIEKPTKDLPNELKEKNRIIFDNTVLEAYSVKAIREQIYKALLWLYQIRQTARD
ncbi:N-6 DNA methylase [Rickettsia endosymbiont of Orchestes rusci]|uniref:N-6 DNA methylase n=1 Tax=Rickettsia endosymbiont of Orchestes rusci TaxID=3066250 RepID=UPI00313AFE1A